MGRSERPLDPVAGPVQRFAHALRELRRQAGGITYRAMAQRVPYSVPTLSQAAAGEKLPSLPVALAYVEACGGDVAEWERRWHQVDDELAARSVVQDAAVAPYRGLARFEADDQSRFFGREQLTGELERAVRAHRVTALFGPSGSGKSSLLRAGLMPRLQRPDDPVLRPAALRVFTPGPRPLHAHRRLLTPAAGQGETWLVADQFEEIFTLCQDPEERVRFLDLLLAALDPGSRLRVVLGVRGDFYGRCLEHRRLADVVRDASVPVMPMSRSELREAIVRPASAAGLIVERALTTRLIDEVAEEPGGLPLLSHALLETWRRRKGRSLTLAAYEAAAGVHGAIAQTAEHLYTQLPEDQAEAARGILLRLVAPGEGAPDTARPADRAELDTGIATDTALVLERLARARLITLDQDNVELAHETVITGWPRLRAWIEEDRERLCAHRRLTEAATAWDELERDPGALYRGTRLASAEEHFPHPRTQLTDLERAFLAAGATARDQERRAAARTTRRLRWSTAALAVLLALALTAGLTAWQQNRSSDRQRQLAVSRQRAAEATALMSSDPTQASLFAIDAYLTAPTREATAALYEAAALPRRQRLTGHTDGINATAFSPDGRTLATSSEDTSVRLWDVATGKSRTIRTGNTGPATAVAFGPGGRALATSSKGEVETTLRLWDVNARKSTPLAGHRDLVTTSAFSRDGRTLATGSNDKTVRVWDVATGKLRTTLIGSVVAAAFSPDGKTLAVVGYDSSVRLREVSTGRTRATLPGHTDVNKVAFSPDGRTLATGGEDGTVQVWDVASRTSRTFTDRIGSVYAVAFSPDGRTLATGGEDGAVRLWDAVTGKVRATFAGHFGTVHAVAFSPDGQTLATGSDDNSVRLWDTRLTTPSSAIREICRTVRNGLAHRDAGIVVPDQVNRLAFCD